jgi:hypothetical protein
MGASTQDKPFGDVQVKTNQNTLEYAFNEFIKALAQTGVR